MDKALAKQLKECVQFLNSINELDGDYYYDDILTNKLIIANNKKYQDIIYYGRFCRMELINFYGVIKTECQEYLNDNGFHIENNGEQIFIRTEKGLIILK